MPSSLSILDHFSALEDPRQQWRVIYPLPEIRLWSEQRLDFLRRFLPYARGLPAHDTLDDVINALDADLFKTCFTTWVESLREAEPDLIAVDGKTSRRCHA